MERVRAAAAMHPAIPLAVVVLVTAPRLESAAARGIGDEEGGAAIPLVEATEVPFAEIRGVVSVRIEDIGDGLLAFRQRVLVTGHAMVRVAAGEHGAAERAAQGKPGKVVRERHAINARAVEVRRARVGIAVGCERLRAKLVAENPDDVGARIARGLGRMMARRLAFILLPDGPKTARRAQGCRL